jgi:hypothetical protein
MTGLTSVSRSRLAPSRAIVCGGLVVGSLDAIDGLVFFGLRGVTPTRFFQGIASGLLGRAAFEGGIGTVLLGGALHFFIAFSIVAAYYFASRGLPIMIRKPIHSGILYGILVYFFMSRVVVPLSAIGPRPFSLGPFINGILIHAFGVGLPSALFVWASEPHVHWVRTDPG